MKILHIDIETFSSVDIRKSGAYKYAESIDFEILLIGYAFDDGDIKIVDMAQGEKIPKEFTDAMRDPSVQKHAHNANFERICFKQIGINVPIEQWYCSAVKAAYMGLPLALAQVSDALDLGDKGKLDSGKALIKLFCVPHKPTKRNGFKSRIFPSDEPDLWEDFKQYCINDVSAEMEIGKKLAHYPTNKFERDNYLLDQKINDSGILIDMTFARAASFVDGQHTKMLMDRMKEITDLDNPNSTKQLREWLSDAMKKDIKSLAKAEIPILLEETDDATVREVLELRIKSSRTSTKKYEAMENCKCYDGRARGLFQFYGANRTGRWAGRLVQLQNLRRNNLPDLKEARDIISTRNLDDVMLIYDDVADIVSQLVRTAFVPAPGKIFRIADFSAVEARVIAWLAGEEWRMEIFKGDGLIYEASAAMMFDVPIELVTKDSEYRYKSKIAELALGYQGGVGAMARMGGEEMGLSTLEMGSIVKKWRAKSPSIVRFWRDMERAAKTAFNTRSTIHTSYRGISFSYDGTTLRCYLPSGRWLSYWKPSLGRNKFGSIALNYLGLDQQTRRFVKIDTYGGKLVENITQAVARDALAYSMQRLDEEGFNISMHVHDETICEEFISDSEHSLERMCEIMGEEIPWAPELVLEAEGFETEFYKKD